MALILSDGTKLWKNYENLYARWKGMIARCESRNDISYHRYGGRGISVCHAWKESPSEFVEWALQNGYSKELQLDRVDNSGNYCPENCRWVSVSENSRNRRNSLKIAIFGETKTVAAWCEDGRLACHRTAFKSRIRNGWDHELALLTPSVSKRKGVSATAFGETKSLAEWSKDSRCPGVSQSALHVRIFKLGWPAEKAVTTARKRRWDDKSKQNDCDGIADV